MKVDRIMTQNEFAEWLDDIVHERTQPPARPWEEGIILAFVACCVLVSIGIRYGWWLK